MSEHVSETEVQAAGEKLKVFQAELNGVLFGQEKLIANVIVGLLARGHILLEGVPGLAKTLMINSLAETMSLDFTRVQFTPDLMPTDITGTEVIQENKASGAREFKFLPGPIFANVILADEINRTPPKTQSALLEAMQERQVTLHGKTYALDPPFFMVATQNPIEMEGTYPLPEAQLDRFLFKLELQLPGHSDLTTILSATTTSSTAAAPPSFTREEWLRLQALVREVAAPSSVVEAVASIILATHPDHDSAPEAIRSHVRYGSSLRGGQAILLAAKARAMLDSRFNVSFEDIRRELLPSLRHRILLNFEAQAEGLDTDHVLLEVLEKLPEKASDDAPVRAAIAK